VAAALATLAGILLTGAAPAAPPAPDAASGVNTDAIPAPALAALPLITELTASHCPELPPAWVVAQVQAESGWDAELTSSRAGGPAGLYQFNARNWEAAGGQAWESDPPQEGADVLSPEAHLRVAVPWVCANLRAVTAHLKATGKPTAPLDAMLVCHIAGCGRVTGSATGIPAAGEAACEQRCAQIVARYVAAVHANLERFTAPVPPRPAAPALAAPAPWTGGKTGCKLPDPTGDGCLTGATLHGLQAIEKAFGSWSDGSVIRSAGCWDPHTWNPRSDHSRGRACDLFPTSAGTFPEGAELEAGWRLANWLRSNAGPLQIKYLIWQGRYWDPDLEDSGDGWGKRYSGGGVYDVRDATGGHFDHVHVSFRE
jgi:hypothetical protein